MPSPASENVRLGIQLVIALFMAIGAWFAVEVWNGQKKLTDRALAQYLELSRQIAALDKANAVTESNRFTTNDWTKANEALSVRFAAQERRIDKQEDLLQTISVSLRKLETALVK